MSTRPPLLAVCLCFALGCGGGDGLSDVTGSVTLDGQPLPEGAITFVPADGKGRTAGAMIAAGQYKARLPPGELKVTITAPKVVGKVKLYDTPNSPTRDVTEEAVPAQYNTESTLKVTVAAGPNTHDFPLVSEKKK